jgi:hypothetical protein
MRPVNDGPPPARGVALLINWPSASSKSTGRYSRQLDLRDTAVPFPLHFTDCEFSGIPSAISRTFGEDHRPNWRSPLLLNGRGMHSAERLCGGGDELIA